MLDYTRNPLKQIYTIFYVASLPARILYILLTSIPRSFRQNPRWTLHQAAGVSIFKLWWDFATTVEFKPSKSMTPGRDGERFIVMPPAVAEKYLGVMKDESGKVKPVKIGGMWYPAVPKPQDSTEKKFALHFHGGAYVLGGCRPMESGWGPEVLARHIDGFVLQPQYRLASSEQSQFPAALQDGLTAYVYLLSLGIEARNIALSGDSAGGNLALGLLRYLEEHQSDLLPLPGIIFLWSPWLDLSIGVDELDRLPNRKTDYVGSNLTKWAKKMYIPAGVNSKNSYISPLGNEFATSMPVFLQTGTSEILYTSHMEFVDKMRKIKGNVIELVEIKNAPHDTFAAGPIVGWMSEAEDAARKASEMFGVSTSGDT